MKTTHTPAQQLFVSILTGLFTEVVKAKTIKEKLPLVLKLFEHVMKSRETWQSPPFTQNHNAFGKTLNNKLVEMYTVADEKGFDDEAHILHKYALELNICCPCKTTKGTYCRLPRKKGDPAGMCSVHRRHHTKKVKKVSPFILPVLSVLICDYL